MGEIVVDVPDAEPAADDSVAFAAGVAAATAATAAEGAQEAEAAAETALRVSEGAAEAAYDARADLESLRGELARRLDEMDGRIAATAAVAVEAAEVVATAEVDDLSPEDQAPEHAAEPAPASAESSEQPTPKKRFGSDSWFGDRD